MTQPTIPRAILYARKSSEQEDRQVQSIDSQVRELRDYAVRAGVSIVDTCAESASAKQPGRPVFTTVVERIRRGEASAILAWHPDRLSRNALDAGQLVHLMDIGKLAEIITPSQSFRATPNDKFLFSLLCSQAKLENDNKSVNVKRGLRAKAERGLQPSPAPLGYLNTPERQKGDRVVILDPVRGPLVRKMFELVVAGTPPAEILRRANRDWGFRTHAGRLLARSTFYNLLTRPFYAGEFEYPRGSGSWHKGAHEPLVSLADFDQVQRTLGERGRPRGTRRRFTYRGLLRCGACGAGVTAEDKVKRQRNGVIRRYVYYHCTRGKDPNCPEGSIEEKVLELQVLDTLAAVSVPPAFLAWGRRCIDEIDRRTRGARQDEATARRMAVENLERRLDRLVDMRANGELGEDLFRAKVAATERDLRRAREALTSGDPGPWRKIAEDALTFACDVQARFLAAFPEERATLVRALASNLVLSSKCLDISVKKPLLTVSELYRDAVTESVTFEPPKRGSTQRRTDPFEGVSSSWFRKWDSLRTGLSVETERRAA
ncbi:MAG: recombinase family protein [Myxococcota bacterium]